MEEKLQILKVLLIQIPSISKQKVLNVLKQQLDFLHHRHLQYHHCYHHIIQHLQRYNSLHHCNKSNHLITWDEVNTFVNLNTTLPVLDTINTKDDSPS